MIQYGEKAHLKSILPRDEICRCFDRELTFHEYSLNDLDRVMQLKPYIMSGLAMSVWTRIEQPGGIKAVHGMPDSLSWESPDIHVTISNMLGTDIIRDMYYVTGVVNDPHLRDLRVAELFAARTYPNCLYIADFDFSMLPRSLPGAGYMFSPQWYLGILRRMIDNAVEYGKAEGCSHLLMNARRSQYIDFFLKRGFLLTDSKTESHLVRLGLGIPMVRQLSHMEKETVKTFPGRAS